MHKYLARALITRPREYPRWPESPSFGVIPFEIRGRFGKMERERLTEDFSEIDRQWRIQWIKDQELHPSEPRYVVEMEREFYNPIRRVMRWPGTWIERNIFAPRYGDDHGKDVRRKFKAIFFCYSAVLVTAYFFKYHVTNWEEWGGWKLRLAKEEVLPGDARWPLAHPLGESWRYADQQFSERNVLRAEVYDRLYHGERVAQERAVRERTERQVPHERTILTNDLLSIDHGKEE